MAQSAITYNSGINAELVLEMRDVVKTCCLRSEPSAYMVATEHDAAEDVVLARRSHRYGQLPPSGPWFHDALLSTPACVGRNLPTFPHSCCFLTKQRDDAVFATVSRSPLGSVSLLRSHPSTRSPKATWSVAQQRASTALRSCNTTGIRQLPSTTSVLHVVGPPAGHLVPATLRGSQWNTSAWRLSTPRHLSVLDILASKQNAKTHHQETQRWWCFGAYIPQPLQQTTAPTGTTRPTTYLDVRRWHRRGSRGRSFHSVLDVLSTKRLCCVTGVPQRGLSDSAVRQPIHMRPVWYPTAVLPPSGGRLQQFPRNATLNLQHQRRPPTHATSADVSPMSSVASSCSTSTQKTPERLLSDFLKCYDTKWNTVLLE